MSDYYEAKRKMLAAINVSDHVWIGDGNFPRSRMEQVTRLTNTVIVVGKGGEFDRYDRIKWGRQKANLSFRKSITAIATEAEIRQYKAKEQEQREEQERRTAERDRIEAKRKELYTLFNDTASVNRNGDGWEVTFSGLTEEQVITLAASAPPKGSA